MNMGRKKGQTKGEIQARTLSRRLAERGCGPDTGGSPMIMDRICLALIVIGALNWGGIGIFKFDAVAWLFGGQTAVVSRIIYTLVALAGLWCVSLFFRDRPVPEEA